MKIVHTEGFKKDFKQIPKSVQEKFGKNLNCSLSLYAALYRAAG